MRGPQRLHRAGTERQLLQFHGNLLGEFVEQREEDGFLGGEVPAVRAGGDLGRRGDLVDGGLLIALP